jgi:hypothetical protein
MIFTESLIFLCYERQEFFHLHTGDCDIDFHQISVCNVHSSHTNTITASNLIERSGWKLDDRIRSNRDTATPRLKRRRLLYDAITEPAHIDWDEDEQRVNVSPALFLELEHERVSVRD